MTHALVLVNEMQKAKSRLGAVLSSMQRRSLVRAMLTDVVNTLRHSENLADIYVMAGCADGAALAKALGAIPVLDRDVAGHCINTRVAAWLKSAPLDPGAPVLILHADLPFLTAEDVAVILQARRRDEVIVATDELGVGSNAIALVPGQLEEFAWGVGSAHKHAALCEEEGQACRVLRVAGAARDIDTPQHLDAALAAITAGRGPGPVTSRWLQEFSLAVA